MSLLFSHFPQFKWENWGSYYHWNKIKTVKAVFLALLFSRNLLQLTLLVQLPWSSVYQSHHSPRPRISARAVYSVWTSAPSFILWSPLDLSSRIASQVIFPCYTSTCLGHTYLLPAVFWTHNVITPLLTWLVIWGFSTPGW